MTARVELLIYRRVPGTRCVSFFWGISAAKNDGFTNKDVDSSHKHARFTGEHADLIVETTKNEGLEFGVQKSKQGKA